MPVDAPTANALLGRLDPRTFPDSALSIEELTAGQVLRRCGAPEIDVYFPITAVLSLMSTMASGDSCEIALVGREGMVGLAGVLANSNTPTTSCVVQVGGTCLRASAESIRAARNSNAAVRAMLDHYTTARLIQVAQVAACNRLHSIGGRLARWLLMLHDRVDGDHLALSQQRIADALGVHRPTIAIELQRLHATGAIRYRSRIVKILDRARLEELACECHAALHRGYQQLFRPLTGLPPDAAPDDSGAAAIDALRAITGQLLMASLHERAARERAEAADRAKGEFLEMVSHELRTPLQAILGWCAVAKLPNPPPGAVDVIERNARVQSALVEDLLDASRTSANTLRISPRQISALGVVKSAIDTVRPAADAKRVALRLTARDELTPVNADDQRLRQVVVNILMNAVKFSPEGSSVEAEVAARDESIEMRVVDRGIGIRAEVLPHVFERFRQGASRAERYDGLGLGLHIARTLVALHGGIIAISSDGEGCGTTCTITLPRCLSSANAL